MKKNMQNEQQKPEVKVVPKRHHFIRDAIIFVIVIMAINVAGHRLTRNQAPVTTGTEMDSNSRPNSSRNNPGDNIKGSNSADARSKNGMSSESHAKSGKDDQNDDPNSSHVKGFHVNENNVKKQTSQPKQNGSQIVKEVNRAASKE